MLCFVGKGEGGQSSPRKPRAWSAARARHHNDSGTEGETRGGMGTRAKNRRTDDWVALKHPERRERPPRERACKQASEHHIGCFQGVLYGEREVPALTDTSFCSVTSLADQRSIYAWQRKTKPLDNTPSAFSLVSLIYSLNDSRFRTVHEQVLIWGR